MKTATNVWISSFECLCPDPGSRENLLAKMDPWVTCGVISRKVRGGIPLACASSELPPVISGSLCRVRKDQTRMRLSTSEALRSRAKPFSPFLSFAPHFRGLQLHWDLQEIQRLLQKMPSSIRVTCFMTLLQYNASIAVELLSMKLGETNCYRSGTNPYYSCKPHE